ncbi:putative ribonuclease H-like domain-containing protein [Tanacetum coccineum]
MDASYFEDSSLKSVADAQIQDQDVPHDDCSFQDDGFDEHQVNTAIHSINKRGSGALSTATPEVNTATSEGLMGPIPTPEDTQEEDQAIDLGNLSPSYAVSSTPHTRIHKDHPIDHVIGDVQSSVKTRKEPKRVSKALSDPAWVEAMQEELLQFKLQNVWVLVDLPKGHRAIGTKWVYRNKKDERGIVVRNKARLVAQGHTQEEGKIDQTLFIKSHKGHILLVQIYVDDIIFGSTKKELCEEFEKLMKDKFQMSSMGELTFFLGLQVQQKKKGIFISQDKYVHEILKKFNYTDVKTPPLPHYLENPLVKMSDADDFDEHLYRSMIGSLMYLTASRPDIMFAVCACARFQVSPKTSHLLAVKRIFRYLKGKPSLADLLTKGFDAGRFQYLVSSIRNAHPKVTLIDQGVGSTSGIRACALRYFDLGNMELENSQNNSLAKLPILKLGEYEMWEIRIKQYFQIQDYALWEVIEYGNSWVPIPITTPESGPSTALKMTVPSTTEEKICKKNDVKARSLLLMALPNEHQLTFNQYADAQSMFIAIKARFGGNDATKKTQKALLKQQYENFNATSSESLDSIFNRLQKLVSRLAILGVDTSPEDLNVKFLRSLPSEWDTHVVVWMNKPDFETMGLDDLYNNFKIVEQKVKRTVAVNNDDKNLAFLTTTSPSSTNSINTANTGVSTGNSKVNTASAETSTASFSDATAYAFLSSQPQGSQLVHEDLEQIHDDDLEEMDLKWNMALLSMRARKFYQRTGRKIVIDGSSTAGYDKSKVECFNCHKMGHFARECRVPRSKDNRNWNQGNSSKAVRIEDASEKAMCAIDGGGFDWSDMAEDEVQANMALMAFTDSEDLSLVYLARVVKKKKQVGTAVLQDNCHYAPSITRGAVVKRDTPDKLQQRSVKCIFIGYPKETMGYYFYFPPENKIVVARYAEFFEKSLITQEVSGRAIDLEEIQDEDTSPFEITSKIPIEVEGFEPPQEEVILIRRSERTHRAPNRLCLNVEAEEHSLGDLNEPTSYKVKC